MNKLLEFDCDLAELKIFARNLAKKSKIKDIYLLSGDLGAGKTTFARLFINSLLTFFKVPEVSKIQSPTFPIMVNYPILNFDVNHYDLYRLKNKNELIELGFFEDLEKNIFLVEWPDIILKNFKLDSYYLIEFKIIKADIRNIKFKHYKKN